MTEYLQPLADALVTVKGTNKETRQHSLALLPSGCALEAPPTIVQATSCKVLPVENGKEVPEQQCAIVR